MLVFLFYFLSLIESSVMHLKGKHICTILSSLKAMSISFFSLSNFFPSIKSNFFKQLVSLNTKLSNYLKIFLSNDKGN